MMSSENSPKVYRSWKRFGGDEAYLPPGVEAAGEKEKAEPVTASA